ncbi:MAG: hypothetical protein JXL97_13535 [Bacteroidales bacterium]|nr:hypothetical protein [Bacteroidales bacterium]
MKLKFFFVVLVLLATVTIFDSCKKEIEPDPNATEFVDNGDGSVTIIDKGQGIGTKTLSSDTVWILQGFVFVNEEQTLTIEAGTLVKGMPGTAENASALIVARGGKINAVGTATNPIVFTANADNYEGTGVDMMAQGLWGGIIILGNATTSNSTSEKAIEGIPTSEIRGLYGGSNDADNSGTMKYVSIRHGGADIGEGNEINGLTLGAVGSATTFEYIEIISNKDDGVEFFGGAPQLKNIVVAYCGDDCYDYDEGFHGKGQFWYAVQGTEADRMGEHDGGPSDNETGTPYAMPKIYNVTYFGNAGGKVITFRDNAGGTYANSIFANQEKGIDIEYLQDANGDMVQCSYKMFEDGNLELLNNVFSNVVAVDAVASDLFKVSAPKDDNDVALYDVPAAFSTAFADYFTTSNNSVVDAGLSSSNPIPTNAQTNDLATYPSDSFFQSVNYKGAFGSTNWAQGWTLYFSNK